MIVQLDEFFHEASLTRSWAGCSDDGDGSGFAAGSTLRREALSSVAEILISP